MKTSPKPMVNILIEHPSCSEHKINVDNHSLHHGHCLDVLCIDWHFVRSIFQILVSKMEAIRLASVVRCASTIDDVCCFRFRNRIHNHSCRQRLEMVGHENRSQFCSLHIWHCHNWSFGHSSMFELLIAVHGNKSGIKNKIVLFRLSIHSGDRTKHTRSASYSTTFTEPLEFRPFYFQVNF